MNSQLVHAALIREVQNAGLVFEVGYEKVDATQYSRKGRDGKTPSILLKRRPGASPDPTVPKPGEETREIVAIAHEFGHHFGPSGDAEATLINIDQRSRSGHRVSREEKELLLADERGAWTRAREILRGLGFEKWKVFDREMRRCIASYETIRVKELAVPSLSHTDSVKGPL